MLLTQRIKQHLYRQTDRGDESCRTENNEAIELLESPLTKSTKLTGRNQLMTGAQGQDIQNRCQQEKYRRQDGKFGEHRTANLLKADVLQDRKIDRDGACRRSKHRFAEIESYVARLLAPLIKLTFGWRWSRSGDSNVGLRSQTHEFHPRLLRNSISELFVSI